MDLINTFANIPEILNMELTPEGATSWVRNEFEKKLGYDYVLVGYLNADSIEVKAISEVDERVCFSLNNTIDSKFKSFINNKKTIHINVYPNKKNILDELGIKIKQDCTVTILPLMIKSAVFGIILGIKFSKNKIDEKILAIAQAYAGICSYIIKDAELSNVFKLQLKILNENIIDKTYTIENVTQENEKIKEAEKIKTEFLMNMSHSLRTPLNAIIGFSEALEMKVFGELNSKQEEYIIDIQNSGKEMLSLVNDILDMSKIEAGAMRLLKIDTDVCLLINEAITIVKSLANKKNIKINTKLPYAPLIIPVDVQKFNQIIYNLLSNAIKFTNANGNIEIGIIEKNDTVEFYVKDDGIGIDKKYHGKIFGKFEQINNDYSGKYASTGLGLTITKELIEMHNGKIWVESKVNNGTKFTFELPIT